MGFFSFITRINYCFEISRKKGKIQINVHTTVFTFREGLGESLKAKFFWFFFFFFTYLGELATHRFTWSSLYILEEAATATPQ